MEVSGFWPIFGLGAGGGIAIEVLRWWKLRDAGTWPEYAKQYRYWIITAAMVMLGGGVAVLYGVTNRSAIMVVNLGAAAPSLIGAFSTPPRSPNGGHGAPAKVDGKSTPSPSQDGGEEREKRDAGKKESWDDLRRFLSFRG
jgi:hypothetical protein